MTLFGVGLGIVAVIAVALVVGALVQGVVGLGLISAPVITLVAPSLMPGMLLVLVSTMPLLTLVKEHGEIDWRGLRWSLPPRVAGTAVGVWLVVVADERTLGGIVGGIVLLAVAASLSSYVVPLVPGTLVGAGFVSGVTGTATTIGGPPFALLYQHERPEVVRPTLAVYFLVGGLLSLGGLAIGGGVTGQDVALAVVLQPALVLGVVLGVRLRGHVDRARFRLLVLTVCTAAAVVLLVRALLG